MSTATIAVSGYKSLPLASIHESTTNPRRTFDEAKLQELAESIASHGIIQPITVRPATEGFELVFGARRFRAAKLAEQIDIPVIVRELSDAQALELQIVELSIVGKSFLCIHAARYVVYM
jgi:ParB/RepB/Spo0J family partition protein